MLIDEKKTARALAEQGERPVIEQPPTSDEYADAVANAEDLGGVSDAVFNLLSLFSTSASSDSFHDKNVSTYMGGYLLRKISPKLKCVNCKSSLMTQIDQVKDDDHYVFLSNKQYSHLTTGGLKVPSPQFADFVKDLENTVKQYLPGLITLVGVAAKMYEKCETEVVKKYNYLMCMSPQCQALFQAMVKLYIKIRIFHVIKRENQNLSKTNQKRNRKFLKVSHL